MSSRPNPLAPSPSNLSRTLTSTHTHYQHISPHRHLHHCIQAGSGNTTAQKTYIKHFSYRKLQTCLSPSIHRQNTRTSCLQPGLIVSFTEQQTLNSQVSGVTIQRRLRYSVTEALRIAEFCSNSAGSVCRFWHCQSSDPPVHPLDIPLDITRIPLRWFETHWSVFQGGLGRGGIQSTSIGHWGSSGVSSWTPPLLHIHYITGSHHTGTWLLLPLLCWWHTAVSLI